MKYSQQIILLGVFHYNTKPLIILQIDVISAFEVNSNFTLPRPLNQSSSSLSRSRTPAVSTENACILLYGREVKSFFLPVIPWTLMAKIRLLVKTMPSRIV